MEDNKELSFTEHLEEFRTRLIKAIIFIIIGTCISFSFAKSLIELLIEPIGTVVFIAPQEAFVANILAALLGGILFSSPFVFYQIWKFISAGLSEKEKKHVFTYGPISFLLFIVGASFGYFIIIPISLKFLLGFQSETLVPMITLSKYISFVGMLTLSFAIAFQLPIAMLFLTKLGIVAPDTLINKRKFAIVLLFIAAALFTPPDIVTQCLMALPLLFLYEIGIICSKIAAKNKEE